MIALIVAHDEHYAIGKDGWMPWNLPEDLKHFKKITLDHDILMGRTTFEAMKKPLPERHTYVATTNPQYSFDHEDVSIVHDLPAFLQAWQEKEETLYICGGAHIYAQCLPYASELWISLVEGSHEADTFFPHYDVTDYQVITKEAKPGFTIIHYRRK